MQPDENVKNEVKRADFMLKTEPKVVRIDKNRQDFTSGNRDFVAFSSLSPPRFTKKRLLEAEGGIAFRPPQNGTFVRKKE
ncbi:MAG: hypothetical protein ACI37U_02490 [Bacteroides sp.]